MKDLLQHDFFCEDTGIKVEFVKEDEKIENSIELRLRVIDPKKRKDKHKENEAIQFDFHMTKDDPEEVAQEMVIFSWVYLLLGTPKLGSGIRVGVLVSRMGIILN